MKITYEVLIDFLIKWYSYRNIEEMEEIVKKQVEIITNVLDIPNLIEINQGGIIFKLKENKYINEQYFKERLSQEDKELLKEQIQIDINKCLFIITNKRKIKNKIDPTNEILEEYYNIIDVTKNDFVIGTFNSTLRDIYVKVIRSSLEVLFGTNFKNIGKPEEIQGFNINTSIENKEAQKILSLTYETIVNHHNNNQ